MKCSLAQINKYRHLAVQTWEAQIQCMREMNAMISWRQRQEQMASGDYKGAIDASKYQLMYREQSRQKTQANAPAKAIDLFDKQGAKINFKSKRSFVIRAADLPKQFGFEIETCHLHYDDDEPVMAKHLIQGDSHISKLFFVFNINEYLLSDNKQWYKPACQ